MALRISSYIINTNTGEKEYFLLEPGQHLGGFEDSREKFWGSPVMEALGLTLLPTLKHRDLHVKGPQLDALENEATLVLANLPLILPNIPYDESFVRQRIGNVLLAVQNAKRGQNGGVIIE